MRVADDGTTTRGLESAGRDCGSFGPSPASAMNRHTVRNKVIFGIPSASKRCGRKLCVCYYEVVMTSQHTTSPLVEQGLHDDRRIRSHDAKIVPY